MDGRSREIPVAQEMEVPAARIESISSFFAPSPFLRPKTPSLFFSEQSIVMSIEKYIARCYWNLGENIVVKVVESRPSGKQILFSKNESR